MAASDASQVVPGAVFDALVELVQGLQLPPIEAFHVAEAVVPALEKVVHTYAEAHKRVLNSIASLRSVWSCLASAASFAPSRAVPQSSRGASLPAAAPSPDADLDIAALRSEIEHGNRVIAELQVQNENAKQQIEQLQQQVQELSAECQARIEIARNEKEKLQLQISELQALLSRGASASEPQGASTIQPRMDSSADVEAAPPSEGKVADEASASDRAAAAARIVGKPDVINAAMNGNIELVKDHVVADAGCVLKADSDEYTALIWSSRRGHLEITRYLVENSANMEARASDGSTALMNSSYGGHLEITRFLVESGASVEARGKDGWTALICSSFRRHLEVTRFLVESGANVEARTNSGRTALMYWGGLEITRCLVESKADVAAKDKDGKTVLNYAIEDGKSDVVAYLRSVGAPE
jgi:hypothetical protein